MNNRFLGVIVVLLLCHVGLRWYMLTAQPAFIDEGYHVTHARIFWASSEHPARYADGKVLFLMWLSPFMGNVQSDLFVARASVGLLSTLSVAFIVALARQWAGKFSALIAGIGYIGMPYTLFYERMALSDPLANTLMLALVWQLTRWSKHPTFWGSVLVGGLLASVTLAKLLTAPLALLVPVSIALWGSSDNFYRKIRHLLPHLIVIALVVIGLWLPMLLPILQSQNTSRPMTLVDPIVLSEGVSRVEYVLALLPSIENLLPLPIAVLSGLCVVLLLAFAKDKRPLWFISIMSVLVIGLPLAFASIITSRYLLPLASGSVLGVALWVGVALRQHPLLGRTSAVISLITILYGCLPFVWHTLQTPNAPPITARNHTEYVSGILNTERSARQAAEVLNQLSDEVPLFATWWICYMMTFEMERPLMCLDRPLTPEIFTQTVSPHLAVGQVGYIAVSHYATAEAIQYFAPSSYRWELVGQFQREVNPTYYVYLWRMERH